MKPAFAQTTDYVVFARAASPLIISLADAKAAASGTAGVKCLAWDEGTKNLCDRLSTLIGTRLGIENHPTYVHALAVALSQPNSLLVLPVDRLSTVKQFNGLRAVATTANALDLWGANVTLAAESIAAEVSPSTRSAILQSREADRQRLLAEQARDAEVARESQQLNGVLGSKDPQAMYLAAGRYERAGRDSEAAKVYERIIDRFPASPWAVKANDHLLQKKRMSDEQNARTDVLRRSSEAAQSQVKEEELRCRVRKSVCGDNCISLASHLKRECQARCESIC